MARNLNQTCDAGALVGPAFERGEDPAGSLVFVHLSDLHFREPGDGLAHREQALRTRLMDDIPKAVALTESGMVEAILLTGDIARSGQRAEYQAARVWLDELCDLLDISPTRTLSCPGNHDIDWNRIDEHREAINAELRGCPPRLMDASIDSLLADPAADVLGPLENYNEFAAGIACSIESYLAWDLPPIRLADGYSVAIRGATSVINSDGDDGPGTMAVQSNQLMADQRPGQLNVLLIHHGTYFWRRPQPGPAQCGHHLALFGHTHEPHHQVVNGSCLELTAGAVHPEEHEAFAIPTYNVIEVTPVPGSVPDSDGAAARIRVFRRTYESATGGFIDGAGPQVDETVSIPALASQGDCTGEEPTSAEVAGATDGSEKPSSMVEAPFEDSAGEPDPSRVVRLDFERLGAGDRYRVLESVGLLTEELVSSPPHVLIRRVGDLVVENGVVEAFIQAIREVQD